MAEKWRREKREDPSKSIVPFLVFWGFIFQWLTFLNHDSDSEHQAYLKAKDARTLMQSSSRPAAPAEQSSPVPSSSGGSTT